MLKHITYILIVLLTFLSAEGAMAVTYGRGYTPASLASTASIGSSAPALYSTAGDGIATVSISSPFEHKAARSAYAATDYTYTTATGSTLSSGLYTSAQHSASVHAGSATNHSVGATAGMAAAIRGGNSLTSFTRNTEPLIAAPVVIAQPRGLDKDDDELGNGELEPVGDALLPLILLALCYAGWMLYRRRKTATEQ